MTQPLRVRSFLSGISKPSRCNEFEYMVSSKCVQSIQTGMNLEFSLFRMLRVLRCSISIVWAELVSFGLDLDEYPCISLTRGFCRRQTGPFY